MAAKSGSPTLKWRRLFIGDSEMNQVTRFPITDLWWQESDRR